MGLNELGKKKTLPAIESISFKNYLYNILPDLWYTLHSSYNLAENRPVNTGFLNELLRANTIDWPLFSNQEFKDVIAKCFSSFTLSLDHIF